MHGTQSRNLDCLVALMETDLLLAVCHYSTMTAIFQLHFQDAEEQKFRNFCSNAAFFPYVEGRPSAASTRSCSSESEKGPVHNSGESTDETQG